MNAAPKTLRTMSNLTAAGIAPVECTHAQLTPEDRHAALEKVAAQYAIAITPAIAELIDRNNPNDPIARQAHHTLDVIQRWIFWPTKHHDITTLRRIDLDNFFIQDG